MQVKLLDGASVFVRLCDARRDDELMYDVPSSKLVSLVFFTFFFSFNSFSLLFFILKKKKNPKKIQLSIQITVNAYVKCYSL